MTLTELQKNWNDTPEYHKNIHESFIGLVNDEPKLDAHRTYVETKVFGMGERSFWWAWKLLLDGLPNNPELLEIGVFKGATLSIWKLLRPDATCYGVTPLDGRGTGWINEDYFAHITKIHHDFGLEMPTLYVGGSEEQDMIGMAGERLYDVVYIDGDHSYEGALNDLINYSYMVKRGGYLVIDDCCCDMSMPWGYFQGIDTVQQAFDEWLGKWGGNKGDVNGGNNERDEMDGGNSNDGDRNGTYNFEFVCNVVHLRILKRK